MLNGKGLSLKIQDNLKDYLSCNFEVDREKQQAILSQPHLIENLEQKLGSIMKDMKSYLTLGTLGVTLVKIDEKEEENTVSTTKHSMYRSAVGMLLYLVKHSRPDIANAVRELSKVLDKPNYRAFKEMCHVSKYVLDTHTYGLKFSPTKEEDEPWILHAYSDSDYAGDKDTRLLVGGFVLYIHGVPVSWRSKSQRVITLSSTEAEWIAASEAVREVIFVLQLLESMKIKVKLPTNVYVDNIGTIFMANNQSTSTRTKHVDVHTKFVTQYIKEGTIKINFIHSGENDSDIFTKNLGSVLHNAHAMKMIKESIEKQ